MCLVRSHTILKTGGVGSNRWLFPLELLLADVHCPVVEILFVQLIVSGVASRLQDTILDDREGTVEDAPSHVVDRHIFHRRQS